jgi:hypothetical protein
MRWLLLLGLMLPATAQAADAVKDVAVKPFEAIHSSGGFEVKAEVGAQRKVTIRGAQAWVDRVEVSVVDGVLSLRQKPGPPVRWKRNDVVVRVVAPQFSSFKVSGGGTLIAERIAADAFSVDASGGGDIWINGTCRTLNARLAGGGDVNAKDFRCRSLEASVSGGGDLEAFASEAVTARISGGGGAIIHGRPAKRDVQQTGAGEARFPEM